MGNCGKTSTKIKGAVGFIFFVKKAKQQQELFKTKNLQYEDVFFIAKVKFMRLFKSEGENSMNTLYLLGSVNPSNW